MFIFGGLSLSSADYMKVGRFCSSRRGGQGLVRVVRQGIRVLCWLGPPCKVKSDRFAVSRSYESLDLLVTSYKRNGIRMR